MLSRPPVSHGSSAPHNRKPHMKCSPWPSNSAILYHFLAAQ
jgi:hypothetical protein